MQNVLIAAFSKEGIPVQKYLVELGHRVQILDCFEDYHRSLKRWYGQNSLLSVQGHRSDVSEEVSKHHYDLAVVLDTGDFVRTALITQSIREAGVGNLLVVTKARENKSVFRRCGAHKVIVAVDEEELWTQLDRALLQYMPA